MGHSNPFVFTVHMHSWACPSHSLHDTNKSCNLLFLSVAGIDYVDINITLSLTANETSFSKNITLLDPDDTSNEEFVARLIPLDPETEFELDVDPELFFDMELDITRQTSINIANIIRIKTGCEQELEWMQS